MNNSARNTQPAFYCPVCGKAVTQWQPFARAAGNGKKILEHEGRLCPYCLSFERTRHFRLYLDKEKILKNMPRFLHLAPERGLIPILRKNLGDKYVTADLFMSDTDLREDITKLSFSDNAFDFIYCSNVLEHVPDDHAAMKELYRVLSPGGKAVIQVPIGDKNTDEDMNVKTPEERYRRFGQADHVRLYGEDIKDRLENHGFKVKAFYMLDVLDLSDLQIETMNLNKRELIHECLKP